MGACTFCHFITTDRALNEIAAFQALVDEAGGFQEWAGTIAAKTCYRHDYDFSLKHSQVGAGTFADLPEEIRETIETADVEETGGKWGPALCIEVFCDQHGDDLVGWIFTGWASS